MTKISFVYFDVGGIFFDWSNVFMSIAKEFDVTQDQIFAVFDKYDAQITQGKLTALEFWDIVRQELNIERGKDFDFLSHWVSDFIPIKENYQLVNSLVGKCKIGIISNIYLGMFPLLIQKKIVPNITYDSLILSCDVHLQKPDLSIYQLAQSRANVLPDEILFIDDSEKYLSIPKKLGWQTYLYDSRDYKKANQDLTKLLKNL